MPGKYAKVVINGPKVVNCFPNKAEDRRKNKLTLKLTQARKNTWSKLGWNGW